jgi:hypothetical protein
MKSDRLITRRDMLLTGLASAGGLLLPACSRQLPPTYGNILRMGDNLTYASHRAVLPNQSLVREYSRRDISSFPATGTTDPGRPGHPKTSETYRQLQRGGFADWRISVEGMVARPTTFSLTELKSFPARTQITRHVCEEGWSAIAEWTGVPLSRVFDSLDLLPTARFVSFYSYDDFVQNIDIVDALHPQTILAYGMNGRDLPVPHGAPVRLRVERQLGYKSIKYLRRIVVTEELDDVADIKYGWAWYVGI